MLRFASRSRQTIATATQAVPITPLRLSSTHIQPISLVLIRLQSTDSTRLSSSHVRSPNPRIPRKPLQRHDEWSKYEWRDFSTFKTWQDLADEFNPKFLFEKDYWKYTWERRRLVTIVLYGIIIPIWSAALAVVIYDQFIRPDELSPFPQPVRRHLRKAIYWAKYQRDDERAMRHFQLAFQAMVELKMDPFSDQVMGANLLMIKYLGALEKYIQARQIYNVRRKAVEEWIDNLSQLADRGLVDKFGDCVVESETVKSLLPNADGENPWGRRTRLLKWLIVMSAEMGSQYHGEHTNEKMHIEGRELIEWALTEMMKENQRRFQEGVKPAEQDWLSTDQIANLYQTLGNAYHHVGDDDYSIALYFKGLQLCKDHCDQAMIMTSLATSFFNWDPAASNGTKRDHIYATLTASDRDALPKTRREADNAALNWVKIAEKHIDILGTRDLPPTCQQAFCHAKLLHGELLWQNGKYQAARKCWEVSRNMALWSGYVEGFQEAEKQLGQVEPAK